jgi:predicted Fe-Mo cluster-binding NifX family protein
LARPLRITSLMKIAISLFGPLVSPRFGYSPEMVLVTIEGGKIVSQERLYTGGLSIPHLINHLSASNVDSLICGGIDGFCYRQLASRGISVVPDVVGDAETALQFFLRGRLRPRTDCRRRGKRFCGGRGFWFDEPNWDGFPKKFIGERKDDHGSGKGKM